MDNEKLAYYEHPLQHAAPETIRQEQKTQIKIAIAWIIVGIVFNIIWTWVDSLHLPNRGGSSLGSQSFNALLLLIDFGAIPYGIYRLLRLRHFIEQSLRAKLVFTDASVYRYHTAKKYEATQQKLKRRDAAWYNHRIVSDRSLMVVLITLFVAGLLFIFGLAIFATFSR